jgi:hypothetical protein
MTIIFGKPSAVGTFSTPELGFWGICGSLVILHWNNPGDDLFPLDQVHGPAREQPCFKSPRMFELPAPRYEGLPHTSVHRQELAKHD